MSNYPNPNNFDDGLPMFSGGAYWPGHEDYRVQTPGSTPSSQPAEEFDPFFDTYSCGQPAAAPTPAPTAARPGPTLEGPTRGKKRMARKPRREPEPAPAPTPIHSDVPNEGYADGRVDYTADEYKAVAQCWIDITEDSIVGTNQTRRGFWDRVAAKYNEVKPSWAYKRNKEQVRKCWDRMRVHLNAFLEVYKNAREARASGESMEDVLQTALQTYEAEHGQFKFYSIWLMLKDKPKFDDGFPVSGVSKRTKNTASGAYSSGSGSAPPVVDLNKDPVASSGTPTYPQRPVGRKTAMAQAKGKGKASSSRVTDDDELQAAAEKIDKASEGYDLGLLYKVLRRIEKVTDPELRTKYKKIEEKLHSRLGFD